MIQIISFSIEIFLKYSFLYFVLFFSGRSFLLIIETIYFKKREIPQTILKIKSQILFPILGVISVGNLLILVNYFLPLKSNLVFLIITLFNFGNLLSIQKIQIKKHLNLYNFINFFVFPAILLISTSDINFHYDAGYYHLNHQNWLRESNMVIGMVNIFWAFGMSSIYEYLSAVLWIDTSFLLLHYLSLIFIHFFYSFLFFNILNSKNLKLKNASLLLIFFSIFDNFGLGGGRNGFLYIQGVGKQDIPVAVLFIFISLIIIDYLIEKDLTGRDLIAISLITFFIFQLKISTIFIYIIFLILVFQLVYEKIMRFTKVLYYLIPNILFAIFWFVKSYMTTGCVVFPVNFLCINNFDWYVTGSTKAYESISTGASFSYIEYFVSGEGSFIDWFNSFFYSDVYSGFSSYYRSFYLNFLGSLLIIYLLKRILFNKSKLSKLDNLFIFIFLISNMTYSIFFGPIPRYTIGILCLSVGILGFYGEDLKVKINKSAITTLIVISIGLIPRANSYIGFFESSEIALYDPTLVSELYNEVPIYDGWIKPDKGDRCFVNLQCTMHDEEIVLNENSFFTTAYRLIDN